MDIQIHSIHFNADQKLLDFIDSKMSKIESLFDRITRAEVYLKLEHSGQVSDKIAEIKVSIPGKVLYSEERSKVFEESVDAAMDNIVKQVKRYKERMRG